METYVVMLEVTTDEGNPRKWDWTELVGDDCVVVSVTRKGLGYVP